MVIQQQVVACAIKRQPSHLAAAVYTAGAASKRLAQTARCQHAVIQKMGLVWVTLLKVCIYELQHLLSGNTTACKTTGMASDVEVTAHLHCCSVLEL